MPGGGGYQNPDKNKFGGKDKQYGFGDGGQWNPGDAYITPQEDFEQYNNPQMGFGANKLYGQEKLYGQDKLYPGQQQWGQPMGNPNKQFGQNKLYPGQQQWGQQGPQQGLERAMQAAQGGQNQQRMRRLLASMSNGPQTVADLGMGGPGLGLQPHNLPGGLPPAADPMQQRLGPAPGAMGGANKLYGDDKLLGGDKLYPGQQQNPMGFGADKLYGQDKLLGGDKLLPGQQPAPTFWDQARSGKYKKDKQKPGQPNWWDGGFPIHG